MCDLMASYQAKFDQPNDTYWYLLLQGPAKIIAGPRETSIT
jgi:hypothetical protein